MSDHKATMEIFKKRRDKNLAFFKRAHKPIYDHFKDYKLKDYQVNILPGTDEVDLLKNGVSIYDGKAKQKAKEEVAEFKRAYDKGSKLHSYRPPFKGEYRNPRFFARFIDEVAGKSPLEMQQYTGYTVPDFYPCIVFMGCGLGYHIQEFLNQSYINSVYILEPDLDKFAASLYAVDWEEMCRNYEPRKGSAFYFLVGSPNDPNNEEFVLWGVLWNHLIVNCPAFPIMTIFYNHLGSDKYDRISDKINEDMMVYLLSWGNYDDELNQLNQAIHNLTLQTKVIPLHEKKYEDVPICVIGAGPSLDDRIECLKAVKDKVIIISCGSSLKSLYVNGIKPDMHVELESDYLNVDYLRQIKDDEWVQSLNMIGPSHLSPFVFKWFKNKRIYFKRESGISYLFGKSEDTIADGTPTCTNLALALACHYQASQVFLFGMDFAYPSIERHHAKGSPYYDKDLLNTVMIDVNTINSTDSFPIEGVNGQKLLTNPNYYTAKRKADNLVKNVPANIKVRNCSDGAIIENADWVDSSTFVSLVEHASPQLKNQFIHYLFHGEGRLISQVEIDKAIELLIHTMDEFVTDAKMMLNEANITDIKELTKLCYQLNWYVEDVVQRKVIEFYFLVRGTMRHFLYVVFSHALSINDIEARNKFILEWKESFIRFLDEIGPHFKSVLMKKFDLETDPWASKSITEAE